MSIAHQIHKLFFHSKFVKYRIEVQGHKCEGTQYVLGGTAGPEASISNLLHEICHFAELEPKRLLKFPSYGWGLYQGKFWQIGTSWGHEPSTDQQVQREARVWAMQLSLERHFNINDSAQELVRSAVWLPAWCFYRRKFTNYYGDKKALYYLSKHVERLSKRHPFEKVIEDYGQRITFLESHVGLS